MNESAASPEEARIGQIRKAIVSKVIQIYKDSPTLTDDEILSQAEAETKAMFAQILKPAPLPVKETVAGTPPSQPAAPKPRGKKWGREDRKDHVGRFFLTLVEKQLKQEGILDCLIPVYAKSIQSLIGDAAYAQFEAKINKLLDFAKLKGFDYNQTLMSKPGKEVMIDLMKLYRSEFATSESFAEQLKNKLDQTLVQNIEKINEKNPENPLNIEDTINQAFNTFMKVIRVPPPDQARKK
jgi:hypothetical protein